MTLQQQIEPYQELPSINNLFSNNKKKGFKIIDNNWNNLPRSNAPKNATKITSVLSARAQMLLAVVKQKLKTKEKVFLNHKYISSITIRTRKQNTRLIQELENYYDITYHNSIVSDGKKYRYVYEFSNKKCLDKTNEKKPSVKEKMSQQNVFTTIYNKKTNIKINRSIKSNNLKNNFSRQYDKPKTLEEENLITKEEHYEIVKRSGREFTLNAMNEILKNMIKRGRKAIFNARKAFKAWFALCIKFELRDAVKTSSTDFYIKGNKTKAEIIEYTTQQEREQYLETFEKISIKFPCLENCLKAKWANVLPPNQAYNFLSNLRKFELHKGTLQIYLTKKVDLWDNTKLNILKEAKALMCTKKLEFIL